jgi:Alkylmercury lyase
MARPAGPVPTTRRGAESVSGPARQVQLAVLTAFAAIGQPPSPAEIERLIRAGGGEPDRVRAELTAADMLAFSADGSVRAAYPFSPVPTSIEVSWADGPHVYAMCAIDALGMSAMLGCPVIIRAAEPDTGHGIVVAVDGDRARWTPRSAVVFAGTAGDAGCPSADRCCGYINFFSTAWTARSWARRHPEIAGTILRRDGALRMGIDQFGALLQPADNHAAAPDQ